MKLLTGLVLILLVGSAGAEAASWASRKRLPKPIDFPVVRKKVKEHHKPGNRQLHPPPALVSLSSGRALA